MKKTLVIISLFLFSLLLISTGSTQTRNYRAGILTVERWIETLRGAPILNSGYYRQTYSGTAADAFKIDYTGSGYLLMNVLADGSSVFTMAKTGDSYLNGDIEVAGNSVSTTVTISAYHDTETTTSTLTMRKADGSESAPAAIDQNAILGTINFNGYDDDGWDNGARIYAQADANWTSSERGTELYFSTRDAAGALTDHYLITADGHFRSVNTEWYATQHFQVINLSPGGSGATQVVPDSNTLGGYNLDADGEYVYFTGHIHRDWDAASDILIEIHFECDVDNSGGNVGDDAEFDLLCYYKGDGDTTNKTQSPTVGVTVGQSARYKQFEGVVTIDYDLGGNVVDIDDVIAFRLNFDATNSDISDVVVNHITMQYQTSKVNNEI